MKYCYIVFGSLLLFAWICSYHFWTLSWELPKPLEKQAILIQGKIVSIPERKSGVTKFVFKSNNTQFLLKWYYTDIKPNAGEIWQFVVKLKRPHGLSNPGGVDVEKNLFQRGIRATGYITKHPDNRLIKQTYTLNLLRQKLSEKLDPYSGLIKALTIGVQQDITNQQWTVFRKTGTSHLMAISGLHIGLMAGFAYLIFNFLWRRFEILCLYLPAQEAGMLFSLLFGLIYACLAGLSIPTQRAVMMLAVFSIARLTRQLTSLWQAWFISLGLVLIINPLSILNAGFYLSFFAVALILYAMDTRLNPKGLWWKWGRMQWVVSIGLIPISLFFFKEASLISYIANFFAIPFVGLIIVPASLFNLLVNSSALFWLIETGLDILYRFLLFLSQLEFASFQYSNLSFYHMLLTSMSVLILLIPRFFVSKLFISACLLLPIIFNTQIPKPELKEAWLDLLDVGQGLSTVVRTKNHLLVYDTGPKYGDWNAGDRVILPYLNYFNLSKIDKLMITHADSDHIGGAFSLLKNIQINEIKTSAVYLFKKYKAKTNVCLSGDHWEWDGVQFEVLYPDSYPKNYQKKTP